MMMYWILYTLYTISFINRRFMSLEIIHNFVRFMFYYLVLATTRVVPINIPAELKCFNLFELKMWISLWWFIVHWIIKWRENGIYNFINLMVTMMMAICIYIVHKAFVWWKRKFSFIVWLRDSIIALIKKQFRSGRG